MSDEDFILSIAKMKDAMKESDIERFNALTPEQQKRLLDLREVQKA